MRGERPIGARLLLAAASVVLSLAGAELFVRIFLAERVDTASLRARLEESEIQVFAEPVEDPELFFGLKPNLDIAYGRARLRTGPDAYRLPSRPRAFDAGAARVAVLGDSSSFGWRTSYEQSYPELYRQHLKKLLGVDVELRNYSVPGYNSQQEIRLFHTRVAAFDPDLLILHHDLNDSEPRDEITRSASLDPSYGDNALHSSLLKLLLRGIAPDPKRRQQHGDKARHRYIDGYIAAGPLHDAHLEELERFAKELEEREIPIIAVLFYAFPDASHDFDSDPIYADLLKPLAARMQAMGYRVVDLYPAYQEMMRKKEFEDLGALWVSPTDAHPNVRGHRFIARQLARFTEQQPDILERLRRRH